MAENKKEIIGYYADDRNIYCVDCILKNQETIKKKIAPEGAVCLLANRVYAMCPDILNDPQSAPWSMDLHPTGHAA
jgi:hypothetical protein